MRPVLVRYWFISHGLLRSRGLSHYFAVIRSSIFNAGSFSIDMCPLLVRYLFIYLFMNAVSKLFFKMHLFLQI